jgi:YHS domain-containing protein
VFLDVATPLATSRHHMQRPTAVRSGLMEEPTMHSLARRTARLLTIVAIAAALQVSVTAQKVNQGWTGLAVKGYDVVAYFTAGAPVKGDQAYATVHEGVTYRFASAANRDAFVKEPGRYVPQFGGFCAYAVSRNYTADIDPTAWRVVDGKLYLNYNARAQAKWAEDVPGNITKGHANWPALAKK